jgi:hypothetical protein
VVVKVLNVAAACRTRGTVRLAPDRGRHQPALTLTALARGADELAAVRREDGTAVPWTVFPCQV